MAVSNDQVTIHTLAGGGVEQLFQRHMEDCLKNIADPNTDPKATRKIVLEFVIMPDEEREVGRVVVRAKTSLAGKKPLATMIFMGRRDGRLVAVEHNPKQPSLFEDKGENVVSIEKGNKGGK